MRSGVRECDEVERVMKRRKEKKEEDRERRGRGKTVRVKMRGKVRE